MTLFEKFRLTDKKIVVTGGAQGIGYAVALGLAEMGADIALLDIVDAAEAAKRIAKQTGRCAMAVRADLTKAEEIDAAFSEVLKEFGRIDGLHNNAGVFQNKMPAEEMTFAEWRRLMSISLDGMFLVGQKAGKIMINQGLGAIVNTASMSAHIVNIPQKQIAYNTAKAGVLQLTKTMAVEWAPYHVRVNSISPGYIKTDKIDPAKIDPEILNLRYRLTPMGRFGLPEELAGGVAYLLSDAASFTTGADLIMDGGYTCV